MAEALAAEVADFGIKVTIIEPGAFHTEFQSSIKNSRTIAEYDAVREKLYAMFTPDVRTDSPRPIAQAPVGLFQNQSLNAKALTRS